MKIYLQNAIFVNIAPFDKLELNFSENEIAVLSAVNGKGKTTILSYIVDAFFEMAKLHFKNEFRGKETSYYRVSSVLHNFSFEEPAFVYLRFIIPDGPIDYVYVCNLCSETQYNDAINLENKIPYNQIEAKLKRENNTKILSNNYHNLEIAKSIFGDNILTYFPYYRYETPGYLNEIYKVNLTFDNDYQVLGYLQNPIEVTTSLPKLANWIMDIVLDNQYLQSNENDFLEALDNIGISDNVPIPINALPSLYSLFASLIIEKKSIIQKNLNSILTNSLISKKIGQVKFGIGQRGSGGSRIQIVSFENNQPIYPSIFNLSSGEASLLCMFGEVLRQADKIKNNIPLENITGIVLIDEVEKHLHIKLQKEVLPNLFNLFPNLQFIVSSHSRCAD